MCILHSNIYSHCCCHILIRPLITALANHSASVILKICNKPIAVRLQSRYSLSSVTWAVTWVYCDKTTDRSEVAKCLNFCVISPMTNFRWDPLDRGRGLKLQWGYFRLLSRRHISERGQSKDKLQLIANRKLATSAGYILYQRLEIKNVYVFPTF